MSDEHSSTTPPTPTDRAAYWQPHIEAWQASGLSVKRFCREHALPYGRFLYWSRKQCIPTPAKPSPSAFTRVVPVAQSQSGGLIISLPGGIQIGGIDADNVALLQRILPQL